MYGYVRPCTALHGYKRLCTAMQGYVSYARINTAMYGYVSARYGYAWLCGMSEKQQQRLREDESYQPQRNF